MKSPLNALESMEGHVPDILLLDVDMPNMDGIEATQHIQTTRPTPVVVLTAHEPPDMVERASKAGVGAYLVKPPRASDIERAITIAMARFADMMELRRLNAELQKRNQELQEALAHIKQLQGLLPICMHCKKIRDDRNTWHRLETYIQKHADVMFSQSLCQECLQKHYPAESDELHDPL